MHYRLPHPGQGILGPAPAIYSSQPTTLPSAFSIMPPQDPTWHMDTGASSHLNFNASHSIIPSHHRPLHLHNVLDYLTRHILLRCDSSGDLYPVTKPSTSPISFLSTSASTWHQCLGHLDDIILTTSCPTLLQQIISSLNNEYDMTDLGALNYFLGIFADRTPTGLFLSQKKSSSSGPTFISQPCRWLQYYFYHPDLSYAVQQIFFYMHDPREPHLAALKSVDLKNLLDRFPTQIAGSSNTDVLDLPFFDLSHYPELPQSRQHGIKRRTLVNSCGTMNDVQQCICMECS
ncbi:ribonuclease H-like domain-containing protein [Tanacetum coccineum]